jgi:hypothetical protein
VEEDKDLEKERRRNGIPSKPKSDHALGIKFVLTDK